MTPMLNKLRHAIHMFKVVAVDRSKLTWRVKEVGGLGFSTTWVGTPPSRLRR
jgi:hypothetical protein